MVIVKLDEGAFGEEDKDAAAVSQKKNQAKKGQRAFAERLPTDKKGAKRKNAARSRRKRRGQRQRLFLRRRRLRMSQP